MWLTMTHDEARRVRDLLDEMIEPAAHDSPLGLPEALFDCMPRSV
jgi:hypothetical protein